MQPVICRIQHDDKPNYTCNDLYPIPCQQASDKKVLRVHTGGEYFMLNGLRNRFQTTTIQTATDCFGMGRTIDQFRRFRLPLKQHLSSAERSEPTYNWIISLSTNEEVDALDETSADADAITDDDDDNLICKKNLNAENYRLCKAKVSGMTLPQEELMLLHLKRRSQLWRHRTWIPNL